MADEQPRVIATFNSYEGLLAIVRARVQELEIKGRAFDAFAGLPDGYLSKLVGQRPIRRIAMTSMGPLFGALGIRCVVIEDPEATERLRQRLKPRNNSFVRSGTTHFVLTDRILRRRQKNGRRIRWSKLTPAQRSQIMRALAHRRWRNNGNGHAR